MTSHLSLRELRRSTASNLMSVRSSPVGSTSASSRLPTSRINAEAALTKTRSYLAAPKKTLNLADVTHDNRRKSPTITTKTFRETRRQRKKREWLARKPNRTDNDDGTSRRVKLFTIGDEEQSFWAYLPDLVLEIIFQMLPYKGKRNAALVCATWSRAIWFRSVWSDVTVGDSSWARCRYNFAGKFYEEVLDHQRASTALHRLAPKLRRLYFLPKKNLHNICAFQRIMKKWCDVYGDLPDIDTFSYTFPCDFAKKHNEIDIYGTGGMVLEDMKTLLYKLPGLKRLELNDLELDGVDAAHVLDEVSDVCCLTIHDLSLINTSRRPFSLLAVASFVNLRTLQLSPHNLGDDLVECIGDMKRLRNLIIITNSYTECVATPVDYRVWKTCRKVNPKLRVHLVTEGKHKKEITFQHRAPIKSIVYDTPYTQVSTYAINLAVDEYESDLEVYAHKRLPRFHMAKSFHERPDSSYVYLVRKCPYVHTLMIRERISSSTVLLLAYTAKNLRYFYVRKNAIILRSDWPKNPEWSMEFYAWLRKNSRSYEDMEREVSQILGFRWYALNDKQFKLTPLPLTKPYYYEGFEEA